MRYYRYHPDANNYAGIGFQHEDDEAVTDVHFTDEPLAANWKPPVAFEFEDNPPKQGDFPSLSNYNEIPVMSERAWEALRALIGHCCEPLPIIHPSGQPYYIIHVMNTIDALDEDRSEVKRFSDGGIMRVVRYALKHDLLRGEHIFKLPRESGGELLGDDEFRRVVEENSLQGLIFKPIPLGD